jgi:hypothetical protein
LTSLADPGQPITDATAGITVALVSGASSTPGIVLEKSSAFQYENGKYVYLLNTARYAPGTYDLTVYGNAFAAYQVLFRLPASTSGAQLSTKIQSVTFDTSANQYVATLAVTNGGTAEANGVIVFASTLNLALTSTATPMSLGYIGPGTTATATLSYPSWAGKDGSPALLIVVEAFAGGYGDAFLPVKLP